MDTLHIPTLIRESAPSHATRFRNLSVAENVALFRRPLPSHEITGGNFRAWATAVCNAEIKHRSRDFARVERTLALNFDRWLEPGCEQIGQFPHEAHAGAALLWLSHLQAHESERRASWDCLPWDLWPKKRRKDWLARRRVLWAGFVRQVEKYRAARAAIDAPVIARAGR